MTIALGRLAAQPAPAKAPGTRGGARRLARMVAALATGLMLLAAPWLPAHAAKSQYKV